MKTTVIITVFAAAMLFAAGEAAVARDGGGGSNGSGLSLDPGGNPNDRTAGVNSGAPRNRGRFDGRYDRPVYAPYERRRYDPYYGRGY